MSEDVKQQALKFLAELSFSVHALAELNSEPGSVERQQAKLIEAGIDMMIDHARKELESYAKRTEGKP